MTSSIEIEAKMLLENPYAYITSYVEEMYPKVGKKVFEVLSLVPCSHILPDFPVDEREERSNINVLLLAGSGASKSSMCRKFAEIAYNSIEGRTYTAASLVDVMSKDDLFSLILEDFSVMSSNEEVVKIIEGVIGEEKKISRNVRGKKTENRKEAVALLCGVPEDLNGRIGSGISGRCVWMAIAHTGEEHSQIGRHISSSIGVVREDLKIKKEVIKKYYYLLRLIQQQDYNNADYDEMLQFFGLEDKEYPAVKNYRFSIIAKDQIHSVWDTDTKKYKQDIGNNWFREQYDGFRFLISHAYLNYFKREVKDNTLFTTDADLEIAVKLLKRTMRTKYDLLHFLDKLSKKLKNQKDFEAIMQSPKHSPLIKGLVTNLKTKKGI